MIAAWVHGREFAVLFVEAARSLGFGARTASGYFYRPDQNIEGFSRRACVEVFVAGADWITFVSVRATGTRAWRG